MSEAKPRMERSPEESLTTQVHVVLPMHVNDHYQLFGGLLMQWIDEVATVAAKRHAQGNVLTAAVDHLSFLEPVSLGETVELRARVTYVGRTSMEIRVESWVEHYGEAKARKLVNRAYLTMVALDETHRPAEVPLLRLDTEEARQDFEAGRRRREARRQMEL